MALPSIHLAPLGGARYLYLKIDWRLKEKTFILVLAQTGFSFVSYDACCDKTRSSKHAHTNNTTTLGWCLKLGNMQATIAYSEFTDYIFQWIIQTTSKKPSFNSSKHPHLLSSRNTLRNRNLCCCTSAPSPRSTKCTCVCSVDKRSKACAPQGLCKTPSAETIKSNFPSLKAQDFFFTGWIG